MKNAEVAHKGAQIIARQFDDIYFNPEDGPAESEYVFMQGNHLPARWQHKKQFSIVETGFGCGLNFLVAADAWLKDSAHCKTLHYYSIEGFPLHKQDMLTIYQQWPQYKHITSALIGQYPPAVSGCHTLSFEQGRIQLHLIFEQVSEALLNYPLTPDCWFLDGFAPSKNPQMWHKDVLNTIGQVSAEGTCVATFTAAGDVRRGLIEAGFEVVKRKGFGRKREMLCAHKLAKSDAQNLIKHAPWFSLPKQIQAIENAVVIGAGMAGAQMAFHLAEQGIKVSVIEAAKTIATGASGNKAGLVAPRLTAKASLDETFYLAAFLYQLRQIKRLQKQGHKVAFDASGLIQLAYNETSHKRIDQLLNREDLPPDILNILTAEQASQKLNEPVNVPAVELQMAGSLAPRSLCKALLDHPNIKIKLNCKVEDVVSTGGLQQITLSDGEQLDSTLCIVANGYQAQQFCKRIKVIPVSGQSTCATLPIKSQLSSALDHAGYVAHTPNDDNQIIFGASYHQNNTSNTLKDEDTQANLALLKQCLPELANGLIEVKNSHVGVRATTPDRWPIIGPLPNDKFYDKAYQDLSKGKYYQHYAEASYIEGMFMLSGLGSRGLTSAAYCANILMHLVAGVAPPTSKAILHAMHPARFIIRDLQKNEH